MDIITQSSIIFQGILKNTSFLIKSCLTYNHISLHVSKDEDNYPTCWLYFWMKSCNFFSLSSISHGHSTSSRIWMARARLRITPGLLRKYNDLKLKKYKYKYFIHFLIYIFLQDLIISEKNKKRRRKNENVFCHV